MIELFIAAIVMSSPDQVELRVTFYDNAGLRRELRSGMFDEAARILGHAGVNVVWIQGNLTNPEAKLIQYPEAPRRRRETEAACQARADIALELLPHAPEGFKATILGVAQPFATAGINVRLFIGRIETEGLSNQHPASALAGHVLAHEIGHVLLRSQQHSHSGLMAGPWGNHEFSRIRRGLLLLSSAEAEKIRSSVTRTGCLSAAK